MARNMAAVAAGAAAADAVAVMNQMGQPSQESVLLARALLSEMPAAIRDAIRKVTDPGGEVVYAGPQGFARAMQLIREKKPVRYAGVIGTVQFDKNGDIAGPFRTWRITNGEVTTVGQMSVEDVQAIQAKLPK